MRPVLSREELMKVLAYDPGSGVFTELTNRGSKKIGDASGSLTTPIGRTRYVTSWIGNKSYYNHRLAWLFIHGIWPEEIDHQDGDGTNNRIANLRAVCHQENSKNQRRRKTNKSGFTGVCWSKRAGKWQAQIQGPEVHLDLGSFDSKESAVAARLDASEKLGFHQNHGNKGS